MNRIMSPTTAPPQQSYEHVASDYDEARFGGRAGAFLDRTDRRIIRSLLERTNAKRVIDVPVGTGRVLRYTADLPMSIVGVDCTPEMLSEAARHAHQERHLLIEGNAGTLPFEDGEFDCLISLRFFHLFRPVDRKVFAAEFNRVVRPGGFAIVSFTNGWYAGGANWARSFLGRKAVKFEYPGELQRLFPKWRRLNTYGNFLPMQRFIDRTWAGRILSKTTTVFPLNCLCWERFHLLQKPA